MIPSLIYMRKIHYLKTRFDNFDYHWKKDTSENKKESFRNCWQVICLQVWDEVQKLHANNCSVNSNLWIEFIIDINDFQHDTFRVQLVLRFIWSEKKLKIII